MNRVNICALLAIFIMAMASTSALAGQIQNGKSDVAGYFAGEGVMAADMHEHNLLAQDKASKDIVPNRGDHKAQSEYVCPMHPEVKSTTPGTCPICKMNLVEVKKEIKAAPKQKNIAKYTCPMHPEVKSTSPGKCPKCKMDLVEAKKGKQSSKS